MGAYKLIELLQIKEKGKIVLVKIGGFYTARGKDAILLNEIVGLKVNCMETEVCKVGFPIIALNKYCKLIEEKKYSYIVFDYNNETNKLTKIREYNGKKKNLKTENKLNCYICKNTVKIYKKPDKYVEAVAKLYEEEMKEKEEY